MRIDELLPLLKKTKRTASGWVACCPSHDDRNPSMAISTGDDGRILLRCFAGCRTDDICSELGITVSDLFDDNGRGIDHKGRFVSKQTSSKAVSIDFGKLAEQYRAGSNGEISKAAAGLGVSVESLERLGAGWDGQAITFPMMDSDRRIIGIRRRFPDGRKLAVKESQSGLFIPSDLPESGAVYFTEGPSDCAAVLSMGLAAIGRPSAADGAELVKGFCERSGIGSAVIVGDNDEPGRNGAERLAVGLLDTVSDIRIVYPLEPHKDIRGEFQAGKLPAALLLDRAAKAERIKPSGGNSVFIVGTNPGDWPEIIPMESDVRISLSILCRRCCGILSAMFPNRRKPPRIWPDCWDCRSADSPFPSGPKWKGIRTGGNRWGSGPVFYYPQPSGNPRSCGSYPNRCWNMRTT
jgi:hypothetical protein